ncbi:MAG: bifunctional nicotinamidase/pyrazinamidase [SAR324 cluster bacterium]|nr:bifunctional nicotinamidase/pyrazinamidase [SAR324 cluster bacterium]
MKAFVVVDVQYDFCPGGSLAVTDGDQVVPFINAIRTNYPLVVFTQDWHPAGHASFASSNPGTKAGDIIKVGGQDQIMWPDHCVQHSHGAEFHKELDRRPDDPVVRKGELSQIDSYSGFFDNDHQNETGLRELLQKYGVDDIDVVGLATDYCVKFTVLDGLKSGFKVTVLRGGCRAVNLQPGDGEQALAEMAASGAAVR